MPYKQSYTKNYRHSQKIFLIILKYYCIFYLVFWLRKDILIYFLSVKILNYEDGFDVHGEIYKSFSEIKTENYELSINRMYENNYHKEEKNTYTLYDKKRHS